MRKKSSKSREKRDSTPASVVAAQIVATALEERVSVADLGELAKSDAAFGMRVLAQVNSGVKNGGRQIADLGQAVGMLGIRGMTNIALGLALSSMVPDGEGGRLLQGNSLRRAIAAEGIAKLLGESDPSAHFTTGFS